MQRGGIGGHLPGLEQTALAIEHGEIEVSVGSVDADKEGCIFAAHGLVGVLVLRARTQAGDSNIEWLETASEESFVLGHSWQGKTVSSKSSHGPVVTVFPLPGRQIFPATDPVTLRSQTPRCSPGPAAKL